MQVSEWRKAIGEMVRDHMRSPELEHYFSVKMNQPRAQLMITQLGLYIRHRRDCWAHVSANCPVMGVKQAILQHEYGEVIKDQFSDFGHLHLIIKQAEKLGLTPQQVIDTKPIATTTATLYAWAWLTHAKSWIEGRVGVDRDRMDQRRPAAQRHRRRPFDAHGQALDRRHGHPLARYAELRRALAGG